MYVNHFFCLFGLITFIFNDFCLTQQASLPVVLQHLIIDICPLKWYSELQGYPKSMRLQRQLYGVHPVFIYS